MPADQAGCAFYRMLEPARIAEREGHEVVVDSDYTIGRDESGAIVPCSQETRVIEGREMVRRIQADVVVMQRPAKEQTGELIKLFRAQGTTVVVDIDDDLSCLHARHPGHDHFNPSVNPSVNWRHLQRACAMADLVTVTTDALAERFGAHGRVAVLPNCVPHRMLLLPQLSDGQTAGWAGAWDYHPGDLEATRGGAAEAVARAGWRFRVVGPEGAERLLGLPSVDSTGWVGMSDYQRALGTLDVGIVPLADTAFNRAKSGLKGLEMAARGVPFVASRLPEYVALAAAGVGLLATDRCRTWRQQLLRLMGDASLRREVAEHGREVVARCYTYEGQGWRWQEAWESAHAHAGKRAAVLA